MESSFREQLISRLSLPLHSRAEFGGLTMATLTVAPSPSGPELELLFAHRDHRAAHYLAHCYEHVLGILLATLPEGEVSSFIVRHEQQDRTLLGLMTMVGGSPIAVGFWCAPSTGMPLLTLLRQVISTEIQRVRIAASRLSKRELEVVALSAEGKTSSDIARILQIGEATVDGHFKNALSKSGARSRAHLVAISIKNGYI